MKPDTVVRPSSRTAFQVLDGQAVVVATKKRTVHRFDDVATDLWRYLEPGRTVREIEAFVLKTYDVDEETAKKDVGEFLETLLSLDLVQVVE